MSYLTILKRKFIVAGRAFKRACVHITLQAMMINFMFSTRGLPSPVSWLGSHTKCVIAAMSGVWSRFGSL